MIPFHELEAAAAYDRTLKFTAADKKLLAARYMAPQNYTRKKLYDSMYSGKPLLFKNYPVKFHRRPGESVSETLVQMLREGLPLKNKARIKAGESRSPRNISISETIERWLRARSKFGVIDLHFRGTKFYHKVDVEGINYFNLLPACAPEVAFLEMLVLVISSKGIFSDSHTDDGDGSNHCFTGKKLWLIWDRNEGRRNGIQDCTVDNVYDQARFSIPRFAALNSAHWFLVSEKQTLFMPGNFTHKVVTLEPYIGFGSFYVSLPGYIHTLKRWTLDKTVDVKGNFIRQMNKDSIKKIKQLFVSSATEKEKWGLSYLERAVRNWKKGLTEKQIDLLEKNEDFKLFVDFVQAYKTLH